MTTNITETENRLWDAADQLLIEEDNNGAKNINAIFPQSLNEEEKRCVSESFNEEELAVFDILNQAEHQHIYDAYYGLDRSIYSDLSV
jgi:hypothetical protein